MNTWFFLCRICSVGAAIVLGVSLLQNGSLAANLNDSALSGFWRSVFQRPTASAPVPADSKAISLKIELGRRLFQDTRLSGGNNMSCASCHKRSLAFTDGLTKARGRNGQALARNTPTLFNLAWSTRFNWDGSATNLESQAAAPITRPNEMGGTLSTIVGRISEDRDLLQMFERSFGSASVTEANILKALAAYVGSLVSPKTRFDIWIEGDTLALTETEVWGFRLFVGKAGCVSCHAGWRFTDDGFHDIGVNSNDLGRAAVPGAHLKLPGFKTPGLRELARSGPYMHNGSIPTLEQVIDHYVGGFVDRPSLSSNMPRDLRMTDAEKAALVAFLLSLSSEAKSTE